MDKYMTGILVPDWVRWIAVDKDGEVLAFQNKPIKTSSRFSCWYRKQTDTGQWVSFGIDKPPKNWKEELYKWE